MDIILEDARADDIHRHHDSRGDGGYHHYREDSLSLLGPLSGEEAVRWELHHPHAYRSGQADEYRVDEEEIDGSEEET